MKEIVLTRRFERDFRRLKRKISRHVLDYETLEYVFDLFQTDTPLPDGFNEHPLEKDYTGYIECHLDADWLLIYRNLPDRVVMHRTGTHRDLFKPRRSK